MPVSITELVISGGIAALFCPVTGVPIIKKEVGFDEKDEQSPHLRFFVDWIGQVWAVDPDELHPENQDYQNEVIKIWTKHDEKSNQNDLIAECLPHLPGSALVLEILDPPRGPYGGEICYVCFDLGTGAKSSRVHLQLIA